LGLWVLISESWYKVGEFSTRIVWAGDHWDVALTEVTAPAGHEPLDDWIGLSATQYVLEMETEGAADTTPIREPVEQEGEPE
jgi:hypothetical protein